MLIYTAPQVHESKPSLLHDFVTTVIGINILVRKCVDGQKLTSVYNPIDRSS